MKRKTEVTILCHMILLGFLLGCYKGRLAVWKDDDPQPYRVYPCPVYLLPKAERNALQRGIRIDNMDDLSRFLENFLA